MEEFIDNLLEQDKLMQQGFYEEIQRERASWDAKPHNRHRHHMEHRYYYDQPPVLWGDPGGKPL